MLFPVTLSRVIFLAHMVDKNKNKVEIAELVDTANGLSEALKEQFETNRCLKIDNERFILEFDRLREELRKERTRGEEARK